MKAVLWLFCAIVLPVCTTVCAPREKVLQPYRLPEFAADARLRQQVNFTALGIPLSDALRNLSEQTGVTVRAGKGVAQWRVVIRVQELPLTDLLASIACAFDLSWRAVAGKEGEPPTYELYQSPAQARRERSEFDERVQLLQRVLPEALAEAQRRVERGETGAELVTVAKPEGDIVSHYASGFVSLPKMRAAASVLTPEAIQRLVSGEDLYIPGDAFTPEQQKMLVSPMAGVTIAGPPEDAQVVQVRWHYEPADSEMKLTVGYRSSTVGGGVSGTGFPLPVSADRRHGLRQTVDLRRLLSAEELRRALPDETSPPKHLTIAELLHRLSVMSSLNVVAEYYPLSFQTFYPSGAGRNVQEVLEILLRYDPYQPLREGDILIFRATRQHERRLCDVPEDSIRRWLNAGDWFGLRVQSLQEIARLSLFQQRALGRWARSEADRLGREGDYRAAVYGTLATLTSAEGTAIAMWRLLMALPPAAQLRALSGQPVLINDFAPLLQLPMQDMIRPFFPINVAEAVHSQPVWLKAQRTVSQHWTFGKGRISPVDDVDDLWLSLPGESLTAFRSRIGVQPSRLDGEFVRAEVETITLVMGTDSEAIVDADVRLPRFKRTSPAQ